MFIVDIYIERTTSLAESHSEMIDSMFAEMMLNNVTILYLGKKGSE